MVVIGLTGASGSGKSYVARIFEQYGIQTLNADTIVHTLYQSENDCTQLIKKRFGDAVIKSDHSVDRQALGRLVFQDRRRLALLNETVHPFVINEIHTAIKLAQSNGHTSVLIDAPQLFESQLDKNCDYIIAVIADHQTRIKRISERDHISKELAEQRLSHQYKDDYFIKNSHFCIYNSEGNDVSEQVSAILTAIGLI